MSGYNIPDIYKFSMHTMDSRLIYYDAFISYKRRGASVWGELLRSVLTYRFGLRIWFDVISISGGEWKPQVETAIAKSQYVIAIFYKGWEKHLEKDFEEDEFLYELKKANFYGCKIIPFFTPDYSHEKLLRSKIAPLWLKAIFQGEKSHNSIVRYCHTAINETYSKLCQQLSETSLILRIHITPNSNCEIFTITLNNSEVNKESIPINGGCFKLDRNFCGVVEIKFKKNFGENEQKLSRRIGIRKKWMPLDSDICDDYWDKDDIDVPIDDVMKTSKPLYHDVTFDWNDSLSKFGLFSQPKKTIIPDLSNVIPHSV